MDGKIVFTTRKSLKRLFSRTRLFILKSKNYPIDGTATGSLATYLYIFSTLQFIYDGRGVCLDPIPFIIHLPPHKGSFFYPIIHLSTHSFLNIRLPPFITLFNSPLFMARLIVLLEFPVVWTTSFIDSQFLRTLLSIFDSILSSCSIRL